MTPPASPQPITEVPGWLAAQPLDVRRTMAALAELLTGIAASAETEPESADVFTRRALGEAPGRWIVEERDLTGASAVGTALALAELIEAHEAEVGPAQHTDAPSWTTTQIGGHEIRHPLHLRVAFPAGTLLPQAPCVLVLSARPRHGRPSIVGLARQEHQDGVREVLDRLVARAVELNPYRGRILRASVGFGLTLEVTDLPAALTLQNVIVPQEVRDEIALGLRSVLSDHELLNASGLGVRRGVLLVGPPGVGKSAFSAAVANEVVGHFTVIYVEASAGRMLLTAVVEEAERLGGPVLLVLEDLDLWVRERGLDSGGLSELLQAMDIDPAARILTIASTNDATTLDAAAIRTGRFDSIVEIGYPDREAAARILAALLDGLPGDAVDATAVAAALPDQTSGSDIREIVRRAVLSAAAGGELSTAALLAEVGSGRYRAEAPGGGAYL